MVGRGLSFLEPPGTYTVELTVDGETRTQPLSVLKDPHSGGTVAEIAEQMELLGAIRDDYVEVTRMVNGAELVRKQLGDLQSAASRPGRRRRDGAAAADLDAGLVQVEGRLFQMRITGGQDGMRWPAELLSKLRHLFSEVGTSDFRPTSQQTEVHEMLAGQVRDLRARYDRIVNEQVAGFNAMLRQRGIGNIVVAAPSPQGG